MKNNKDLAMAYLETAQDPTNTSVRRCADKIERFSINLVEYYKAHGTLKSTGCPTRKRLEELLECGVDAVFEKKVHEVKRKRGPAPIRRGERDDEYYTRTHE